VVVKENEKRERKKEENDDGEEWKEGIEEYKGSRLVGDICLGLTCAWARIVTRD
jgi:hypothetical protein